MMSCFSVTTATQEHIPIVSDSIVYQMVIGTVNIVHMKRQTVAMLARSCLKALRHGNVANNATAHSHSFAMRGRSHALGSTSGLELGIKSPTKCTLLLVSISTSTELMS